MLHRITVSRSTQTPLVPTVFSLFPVLVSSRPVPGLGIGLSEGPTRADPRRAQVSVGPTVGEGGRVRCDVGFTVTSVTLLAAREVSEGRH